MTRAVDHDVLVAVLDRLLPPNGDLPGAGGLGLAGQVPDSAAKPILDQLPADFLARDAAGQRDALKAAEAATPAFFHELVRFAYVAYYRDARVLAGIELATGYPNRPPQPLGYEMEPFDESILEVVRSRGPQYRDTKGL